MLRNGMGWFYLTCAGEMFLKMKSCDMISNKIFVNVV
jgi:hypothetical protein